MASGHFPDEINGWTSAKGLFLVPAKETLLPRYETFVSNHAASFLARLKRKSTDSASDRNVPDRVIKQRLKYGFELASTSLVAAYTAINLQTCDYVDAMQALAKMQAEKAIADAEKVIADAEKVKGEAERVRLQSLIDSTNKEIVAVTDREWGLSYQAFCSATQLRKQIRAYTGFKTVEGMKSMYDNIINTNDCAEKMLCQHSEIEEGVRKIASAPRPNGRKFCAIDKFVYLLFVLRMGCGIVNGGGLFGFSRATSSRVFDIWINHTASRLKKMGFMRYPSREEVIKRTPPQYRQIYGCDIRGILDPTEIEIEKPRSMAGARACKFDVYIFVQCSFVFN